MRKFGLSMSSTRLKMRATARDPTAGIIPLEEGPIMAMRNGVQLLAEDIWDTPDDGNRYEVIDGDLYMTPPPVEIHQRGAGNLFGFIWQYLLAHPVGSVYAAPIGVTLDDANGLQPDIVYVSNERRGIIKERGFEGAPDLVVEVLSPSTEARDRGVKLRR